MIYSIWDHAKRAYDYYEAPGPDAATSSPRPGHLRNDRLGAVPEEAAWPLPAGARRVGAGKYPRGMVASRSSGGGPLGLFSLDVTPTNLLLWGVLGYVTWKFVLPAIKEG